MRLILPIFITALLLQPVVAWAAEPVLVIHGGAGTIRRTSMTPEREQSYRAALNHALRTGQKILVDGGSALDAVEAAVQVLEDHPLFNAGRGAVFTHEGVNEHDASIMDGATRNAGAVAGVSIVRSPIAAARAVMERSNHVMLSGRGAEQFAREQGLEIVEPSYFWTAARWRALQDAMSAARKNAAADLPLELRSGTVGAVALDRAGNLAAATSTGGMTNKRWGRIGDSPVIGAGTFADNETCAVSATGHGEYFIRWAVAHEIASMMRYGGRTVQEASVDVIQRQLKAVGGDGGVIALDRNGNFALEFNSEGMYRGYVRGEEEPVIALYRESD